jgi:flagellar motor switch protein FliG
MNDIEGAAILLLGLGEEQAAEVLKHLDHKDVEKIAQTMTTLKNISKEEMNKTMNKFVMDSSEQLSVPSGSSEFIKNALLSAVGEEKANSLIDNTLNDISYSGIEKLQWQPPKAIVAIIRNEHPQIIAVLLSYLEPDKAARVMELLSKPLFTEVVQRMAKIKSISSVGLKELSSELEASIKDIKTFKEHVGGGEKVLADIVNFMDAKYEEEVIKDLSSIDETLCEKLKEHMFPFEKLADIDKRSLQTLLRDIVNEELVLALKGADESIRKIFYSCMSERAATMLQDDLESLGPIQLNKVISAQKNIVATAQRMAKEGTLMLGVSGDEMVS